MPGMILNGYYGNINSKEFPPLVYELVPLIDVWVVNSKSHMREKRVGLIDTGSNRCVIDKKLASDMELPKIGSAPVVRVGEPQTDANIVEGILTIDPAFKTGYDMRLGTLDFSNEAFAILLGQPFLYHYKLVLSQKLGDVSLEELD